MWKGIDGTAPVGSSSGDTAPSTPHPPPSNCPLAADQMRQAPFDCLGKKIKFILLLAGDGDRILNRSHTSSNKYSQTKESGVLSTVKISCPNVPDQDGILK